MKREDIKTVSKKLSGKTSEWDSAFSVEKADEVLAFHKSIPGYEETPLVRLDALSKELGVSSIAVKGMRVLASPPGSDRRVVSGESGAPSSPSPPASIVYAASCLSIS